MDFAQASLFESFKIRTIEIFVTKSKGKQQRKDFKISTG
ncbi:hypothetical protein TRIP_C10077 [Candidatus Zixiibacteriota bacterium]|nr:hypothetical protein TRIP_C10077 [candidate division Zixibacteria bacterium]